MRFLESHGAAQVAVWPGAVGCFWRVEKGGKGRDWGEEAHLEEREESSQEVEVKKEAKTFRDRDAKR